MAKIKIARVVDFLKGKKTYFIALCGVVWGIYNGDKDVILIALGLAGLRNGVTTEITNLLRKKK